MCRFCSICSLNLAEFSDTLLEDCDLLVGIFWTKLGAPTGASASGTVEEIERHQAAGKPAMIYFSTEPVVPQSIDQEQFAALMKFKDWCKEKGLIETFENITAFRQKFMRQLQIMLRQNSYLSNLVTTGINASPPNVMIGASVRAGKDGPLDEFGQQPRDLSEEAGALLIEASFDKNGAILKPRTHEGLHIKTNSKIFGDPSDHRSMARWEFALKQLIDFELVVSRGNSNQIFDVTELGYRIAETIRSRQQ
jgi:hypothetical protein